MNFYHIWGSMPTSQRPWSTLEAHSVRQCFALRPYLIGALAMGEKFSFLGPRGGLWDQKPLRLAGEERRLSLEPLKETPTWTEPMVTQWEVETVVLKRRRRECEEEEFSAPFSITRRQLGAASCWPLMTNSLAVHTMMLCAGHTGYLHLVCYLPDLFLDKYRLLFKNVLCLTSEDRRNLINIG